MQMCNGVKKLNHHLSVSTHLSNSCGKQISNFSSSLFEEDALIIDVIILKAWKIKTWNVIRKS